MGWETGVSLGAAGVSAFANTQNAEAQSSAIAATAQNQAANLANKTSRNIGSLESSFLRGGIALDGAGGTAAVFQQAGQQGLTDINRTIDNANASISDTMNKARTQSLNTIAASFGKLGSGAIDDAVSKAYDGSWLQSAWNSAGQEVGGALDPSPVGPYQAFGIGN